MEGTVILSYCTPEVIDFKWMDSVGLCNPGSGDSSNCSDGNVASTICNQGNTAGVNCFVGPDFS